MEKPVPYKFSLPILIIFIILFIFLLVYFFEMNFDSRKISQDYFVEREINHMEFKENSLESFLISLNSKDIPKDSKIGVISKHIKLYPDVYNFSESEIDDILKDFSSFQFEKKSEVERLRIIYTIEYMKNNSIYSQNTGFLNSLEDYLWCLNEKCNNDKLLISSIENYNILLKNNYIITNNVALNYFYAIYSKGFLNKQELINNLELYTINNISLINSKEDSALYLYLYKANLENENLFIENEKFYLSNLQSALILKNTEIDKRFLDFLNLNYNISLSKNDIYKINSYIYPYFKNKFLYSEDQKPFSDLKIEKNMSDIFKKT